MNRTPQGTISQVKLKTEKTVLQGYGDFPVAVRGQQTTSNLASKCNTLAYCWQNFIGA